MEPHCHCAGPGRRRLACKRNHLKRKRDVGLTTIIHHRTTVANHGEKEPTRDEQLFTGRQVRQTPPRRERAAAAARLRA